MITFPHKSMQSDFPGHTPDLSSDVHRSEARTMYISRGSSSSMACRSSSNTINDEPLKDLAFAEIESSSSVLIYTFNSVYQLEMVDLAERCVRIKGGLFGQQAVEVFFGWQSTHLRVGSCALFFFQTQSEGMLRLMTSRIRGLFIKKK